MNIQQEKLKFRPITLKLETREEAEALVGIMDKICACIAHTGADIVPNMIGKEERGLAIKISDAFTDREVTY